MDLNNSMNNNHKKIVMINEKSNIDEPDLNTRTERSVDEVRTSIEYFLCCFADRYPASAPISYIGPLDEALNHSVFEPTTPCPLILYIHHDRGIGANIFCENVLCKEVITDYLAGQFLVWTWDRTQETDYSALLFMLLQYTNENVVTTVTSAALDMYPLLVCLSVHRGQIDVTSVIRGTMSKDETLFDLVKSRTIFDCQIELSRSAMSYTYLMSDKSRSIATYISKLDTDYLPIIQKLINDFENSSMYVIHIAQLENAKQLINYLEQKTIIDAQVDHDQSEQLLFHGCSRSTAENIIQYGFDPKLIGMHGSSYGHGFYFSSNHLISHTYTEPDRLHDNERTMLVCRVLVDRTSLGDDTMRTYPPDYDSITDQFKTYVVFSNEQILPVYMITYKDKLFS